MSPPPHALESHEESSPRALVAAWQRERAARLEAEAALALERAARSEGEARLTSALAAARVGTWRMDLRTGHITRDRSLQRILGLEPHEVQRPPFDWARRVHPEDLRRVDGELTHALREQRDFRVDYRILRPDGEVRWLRDRGTVLLDERGEPRYLTGAAADVTEEHLAQEERERYFRVASDLSRRAEAQARERADFERKLIGIVSHDLRNPLSAIRIGGQSLLRHGALEPRARRVVEHILSSAERGARMVRDLLDFTQARLGGGIRLQPGEVEFHRLAEQTVEEVRLCHPGREIHLSHEGNGHGEWDADRLAQVITNLVGNAVKYSPEGTPIQVHTRGKGGHVTLSVHNHGAPIAESLRARLFQPMQRGCEGMDPVDHGVGLGLYIVKHLVEAHGGRVDVESSTHGGTRFTVCLPRRPALLTVRSAECFRERL